MTKKPRNPDKSEIEHLKGLLRESKKENRQLKKEVNKLRRHEYYVDNQDLFEDEFDIPIVEKKEPCTTCGKGFLKEVIILDRVFKSCEMCDYRTKAMKIGNRDGQ